MQAFETIWIFMKDGKICEKITIEEGCSDWGKFGVLKKIGVASEDHKF